MDDKEAYQEYLKQNGEPIEPPKKFRCPSCYYKGEPIYLTPRPAHVVKGRRDYSDVPLCPYCLNQAMWRLTTQMVEEP